MMRMAIVLLLGLIPAASTAFAAEPTLRFQIPATVSPEAARDLTAIYAATSRRPPEVKPASIEDWDRQRENTDRFLIPASNAMVAKLGASVQDDQLVVGIRHLVPAFEAAVGKPDKEILDGIEP